MERMHLQVRAISPANRDQWSPNLFCLLATTLVKTGGMPHYMHIHLFISVFILPMNDSTNNTSMYNAKKA